MSTVINPNNNLLYIAGDTFVEDGLTVRLDTEIKGDLKVTDIVSNDIDAKNIKSTSITNTGLVDTSELLVTASTILNGTTEINGTLTVNGVATQQIGTPSELIETYYGDYLEVNELVVNDRANIPEINANVITANSIFTETLDVTELSTLKDIEASGYADITGDVDVGGELVVQGNVQFAAQFEMLDAEYKKDFFDDPVAYTIFVKKDGDDARTGRSEAGAVATIRRGLELARELRREVESTIMVTVGPGIYVEDGGLEIPERCAMVSKAGQYVTEIHASELCRKEYRNMILMNSGSYCQGFTFRGQEVDDFDDPSGGFAYAFAPGARILRSPYCRDSSQVSNEPYKLVAPALDPANGNPEVGKGGGAVLADRSVVDQNSVYPGFLCFGVTPRSPNGLGYVAKNGAFVNGISSLTIYQRCSFYALNGGQVTLNNSGTQFGDISLRATGNSIVISPAEVSSTDVLVSNVQIAEQITSNADVIVDALWNDLVNNCPYDRHGNVSSDPKFVPWTNGFEYDTAKCQRDVGLIIDSVAQDLIMRTNYNSTTAGLAYHRGVAGSQYVLSNQFNQTLKAIDYIQDQVLELDIADSTKQTVKTLFENVYAGIRTGDLSRDVFYETPGLYPYNEAKCFRDVGFIVEAVALDAILETNYNSVTAGLAYQRAGSNYATNGQTAQTVAALEYARDYLNSLGISAATQSKITASITEIIDIIENNTPDAITYPSTYSVLGASGSHVDASIGIQSSKLSLIGSLTDWIAANYPRLEYDVAKCERDTGFILDALSHDILYGGTYAMVKCAQAYFVDTDGRANPGVESQLGDGESTPSAAAYEQLKTIIGGLDISTAQKEIISDLLDIVITAIKTGTNEFIPEPVEPMSTISASVLADYSILRSKKGVTQQATVDFVSSDLANVLGYYPTGHADDARDLLVDNKTFILDEVQGYIETNYPSIDQANINVCLRDAGFIIDGIVHDVTYGGNFATRRLADAYYEDSVLVIPAPEKAATLATWSYLSSVMQSVVQGTATGQTIYPHDLATATEAGVISTLMNIVIDYIDNAVANPLPAEVLPSTAWVQEPVLSDYGNIISAISTIQADTTNYVDSLYSNYFENKCKEDERRLVESIVLDLRAGTQMVCRAYAQGYFNYRGELAVPSEQLPAFEYVWDQAKTRLQAEAGGSLTDEGIMIGELIEVIRSTVTNPTTVKFGSLVESLAHQFNNAGAGVNQNALPLNFRRPGYNRPVPFSVLQENGGRVRWSGADEINNQYFAGGTRINGQTGKFEGRPFNISVRAIARRLANSRGGF